jgi:hypothetical protein
MARMAHDPLPHGRRCGVYWPHNGKAESAERKQSRRSETMTWETPEFVEVKMDAEINSYQDDFGGDRDTGV